jgi:hypothetical protein
MQRPLPEEFQVTPQEQQLLMQLTQRINQTQLQEKDPDAENLLGRELGANPDAMYMLAQTVLVQNIALEQAKAQVSQLQQQVQQARQQPAHSTSFLGRLLGDHDPQPQQQVPPPYQPVPQPVYVPPPPQYAPQYGAPQYQQPQFIGAPAGQPSFLRGAMQTAAGVAAGALAFEGVESILHGFGHGGYGPGMGMGGFGMEPGIGMGGGFGRPVDETVVNNYYDSPGGQAGQGQSGQAGEQRFDQGGNEPHFHESADSGGAQFTDAGYNTQGSDISAGQDNQTGYDQAGNEQAGNDQAGDGQGGYDQGFADDTAAADNSVDDVQIDDSTGSDDGGGGFDNSGGDGF